MVLFVVDRAESVLPVCDVTLPVCDVTLLVCDLVPAARLIIGLGGIGDSATLWRMVSEGAQRCFLGKVGRMRCSLGEFLASLGEGLEWWARGGED